jgi:hemicentin
MESLEQTFPGVENDAAQRARSVVSLRDIQRVFHLIKFFLHDFPLGLESPGKFRRAMLVSVGMVYYLRLDSPARMKFLQHLNSLPSEQCQDFDLAEVLNSSIELLIDNTEIPEGIALTRGLKENLFMTFVVSTYVTSIAGTLLFPPNPSAYFVYEQCTLSRTPLMIIGPPGCSKTLAVNIATDNANGEESPSLFYRQLPRLQPFHYQCSKSSTSNEIAFVFKCALQRQFNSKSQCLVFMDEAGLTEEEKESLKVLHYLLEGHMSASPEVGFVCITNHILDAAKSNRCHSYFTLLE